MFPTPHTVTHTTRVSVGENALGQPVVETTTAQRDVYGWSPKQSDDGGEPTLAGRVITEINLLTPDGDWVDGDTVTLPDGRDFVVVGDPDDNNAGPFGFTPGYRVTLRRVHHVESSAVSGS